ncbi:hypothetical protein GCM10010168_42320 [Actinoplanes ianthinogenes]|uniref:DM13 domain-containing protein n=1 Tax=Actinoplanes ianthinogenes TaxID=122358 RepID=A0ABM7LVW4_9ACTN|nr:DM13 domain-containing protein [Actinoplanes ianthinogenes]BCJ43458.1 hypothetical protein Aiant_41150 [Actinoplanes ianthinogenes]GGR19969.1 hypothetical protein GCM10010168_42320 [Actinoplanes ianthinogenes]
MIRRLLTKPATWIVAAVLGVGALYWFQPWRLFTDTTVTDSLAVPASAPPATAASASASASAPAAPVATVVAQGSFVTHEHDTTGTARIVRNADGSHQLELVGLDTTDGPDLRVWLTDQPVRAGAAGWRVFDDGEYRELGRLKGNHGDQVYAIPAGVDPAEFRSVSIWCKRFSVSFGAAALSTT